MSFIDMFYAFLNKKKEAAAPKDVFKKEGVEYFKRKGLKPIISIKVAPCNHYHYWECYFALSEYNPISVEKWSLYIADLVALDKYSDDIFIRKIALPDGFPDIKTEELASFFSSLRPNYRDSGEYALINGKRTPRTITSENVKALISAAKAYLSESGRKAPNQPSNSTPSSTPNPYP